MITVVEVRLNHPQGPHVIYVDGTTIDEVESAVPRPWQVDWSELVLVPSQTTNGRAVFAAPLYQR